jgi:hypothetical protein
MMKGSFIVMDRNGKFRRIDKTKHPEFKESDVVVLRVSPGPTRKSGEPDRIRVSILKNKLAKKPRLVPYSLLTNA